MIIGISGKKQHGKDTVAKMIQYLLTIHKSPEYGKTISFEGFSSLPDFNRKLSSGWEIKRFATKLKQIVALLIGCNVEQLEDNKFKETPLGEEWRIWYWVFKSDGVRVGQHIYMSEQEARTKHLIDETIFLKSEVLTPRKMLQLVGTECGRDIIHPNIWINALMADYKWDKNTEYTDVRGGPITTISKRDYPDLPNWIVPDVRFPNEAVAIENKGGILERVYRPNPDRTCLNCGHWWFYTPKDDGRGPCPKCGLFNHAAVFHEIDNHPSEIALDNWRFEHMITNNTDTDGLLKQVEYHLRHYLKLIP